MTSTERAWFVGFAAACVSLPLYSFAAAQPQPPASAPQSPGAGVAESPAPLPAPGDSAPLSGPLATDPAAPAAPGEGASAPRAAARGGTARRTAGPQGADAETVVVVGTRRSQGRTVLDSPVAIDLLDVGKLSELAGDLDVNQLLHFAAPSFNANRQSGADGSDHVDPATLRGLGPDQTLVLVNGKRRYQSSLINIFGTRGRGNTGTDLNAIPLAAIERIEVLRDGASAQYGSDAIAGVINVILKSGVEELETMAMTGVHNARPPSKYAARRTSRFDGERYQVSGNYGARLGERGFLNLSAEYLNAARTTRAADPAKFATMPRRQFGDAALEDFGAAANAQVPLSRAAELYAFGTFNNRYSDAYAWTRNADDDRNVPELYPDGFDPRITARIADRSLSAGVRTELAGWEVDVNNTFGENRFHYVIANTLNASLLASSPTRFDAGGHELSQNTTGVYVNRLFPGLLEGASLALGAEHRLERYQIFAGEETSYRNYGIVEVVDNGVLTRVDLLGKARGSQGFPGFQPANEVDETRTNLAGYVDAELDLTGDVMVGAAVRAERYSDFGSTLTAKAASRWTLAEGVALRVSASTGFRAPSLAQVHHNAIFTDFVSGRAVDKIIAKNNSPITRALGIPRLREESSRGASAGLTVAVGGFSASLDGYYIAIDDRIVLTGAFGADNADLAPHLEALDVEGAQFFANALDTETFGVDALLAYDFGFDEHRLRASFAGNYNHMELGELKTGPRLTGADNEEVFFGRREQHFLLASAPRSKLNLGLDYRYGTFGANLRIVRFDEVVLIDWGDEEDVYEPAITADVSLSWRPTDALLVVVGAENILNAYPTQQDADSETGGLWDAVQMGFSGSFYFARLVVRI